MMTPTNLHDDELDEQQLNQVTGGFIPGLVQPVILIGDGGSTERGTIGSVSASAGASK
jgi:bacteriocin-like protein